MSLNDAANAAKQALQGQANPSVAPGRTRAERKRVPMNLPMRKLEVPQIPGFRLHWIRGEHGRLQQAQAAGYEFVSPREVQINNLSLGGDITQQGGTDLGDRVSLVAGGVDENSGQAVRLYLMKIREEWYKEDKATLQSRNDAIAAALTASFRNGTPFDGKAAAGETEEDVRQRYVKEVAKLPALFRKKR